MPVECKILVATDLSARCDRCLERAMILREQLNASLVILHVLEEGNPLSAGEEQRIRELLVAEFDLGAIDADVCFAYGPVPSTIARVAEERGCSLIVTGVARFNSPRDFLLGTAVDYLVRESRVPVLVVKRRAHQPYDRLVVATDLSPVSRLALVTAMKLFPNADVRLVHVYQPEFEAFLEHDTTVPLVRNHAQAALREVISSLPVSDQERVKTVLEEGQPMAILAQHVRETGQDLLVLGTKAGRTGHAHFAGSEETWHLPSTEPFDVLIVRQVHHSRGPGEESDAVG